jgi:hypothetical protein
MSDNSREKREFEERVKWGMAQAFIPHMKTPESDGRKQVYLYGRDCDQLLENTVTFLPPPLQELIDHQQREMQLHYAGSQYYFDAKPPNLFADGVVMTLISLEVTPWLTVNHLDSLSQGVSMGKFVPYTLAYSMGDEWFSYDIYHAENSPFEEPIVVKYFSESDGSRPVLIGLAATTLVHGYDPHEELMALSSNSFIPEYDDEIWNRQPLGIKPYRYFHTPTQKWRGHLSGPNHKYDC